MTTGQDLQHLILDLAERMSHLEQSHAKAYSPPLTPAEMSALRVIVRSSPVRMTDLAQNVGLPQSSATNLADKLCRRALVNRARPEANRRVVMLSATPAAQALIARIEQEQVALCDTLVARLEPAKAALLRPLLDQLSDGHANPIGRPENDN